MDAVSNQLTAFAHIDGYGTGYQSTGGFADAVNGGTNTYVSFRDSLGWVTRALTPPLLIERPTPSSSASAVYFADDLSRVVLLQGDSPVIPGHPEGTGRAVFVRNVADGSLAWITRPTAAAPEGEPVFRMSGASEDLEHVVFRANPAAPDTGTVRLIDEDTARARGAGLYDYTDGRLTAVGILPDGSVPAHGAVSPAQLSSGGQSVTAATANNQVSRDGRRIVFVSPDPGVSSDTSPRQLYLRIDGTRTQLISRSMVTGLPANDWATFQYASPDGSRIWFRTTAALTNDAPPVGSKLYRFDSGPETVTLMEPDVGAPLVSSDDGSRFLYVATGTEELWLNDGGVKTRVASPVGWSLTLLTDGKQVRTTPDGSRFVFASDNEINPGRFNNGSGQIQVYVYDVASGSLDCASCPSDSSVPAGTASIASGDPTARLQGERVISRDGRRVIFDTTTPLVARDANARRDTYLWEDGDVSLISSAGPSDSTVADMSASGDDIFFLTRDRLVPQDVDGSIDIYDARVSGGFPRQPPEIVCELECQPPPTPRPMLPAPVTTDGGGSGNLDEGPVAQPRFAVGRVSAAARRRFARTGRLRLNARISQRGRVSAIVRARSGRRWYVAATAGREARTAGAIPLALELSRRARRQLAVRGRLSLRVEIAYSGRETPRRIAMVLRAPRTRSALTTGTRSNGGRNDA
jgi:Tol biopolymer transport system component